jgi:hypothetical protein
MGHPTRQLINFNANDIFRSRRSGIRGTVLKVSNQQQILFSKTFKSNLILVAVFSISLSFVMLPSYSAKAAPSFESKFLSLSGTIAGDKSLEPKDKYLPLGRTLKSNEKSKILKDSCSAAFPFNNIGAASALGSNYTRTAKGGLTKSSGTIKWDFNDYGEAILKVSYSCAYSFKRLELLPGKRWKIGLWQYRPDVYSPDCTYSQRDLESTKYQIKWNMKFSGATLAIWKLTPRTAVGTTDGWYNSVVNADTSYCRFWYFSSDAVRYQTVGENQNIDIYKGELEPRVTP